ncbi:hypothetical protein M3A49_30465 [Paraburkholderia sp. CNPSo 3076]|uniref:hypothetical protein n=1 Tax=Paraburkholderia sp. CNPSo 3076 TaxID=2940936 RepID=UPI0022501AC1|nr:hypothetical protein [Paraburkholderia sp. CNPSo 3076]MCX5543760.1 hypothetical protein [Paraburkholderia sp. CNPSo 3076]
MDPKKTANMINPMDYEDVLSERIPKNLVELARKSDLLFNTSVIAVCVWAVIETPLELGGVLDPTGLLALVTSKVLLGFVGTAAIANLRFARRVFTFICGAGVFAIAPALPLEYSRCVAIAIFSTVECIGKAACVASFVIASSAGDSVGVHLSVGKRTTDD